MTPQEPFSLQSSPEIAGPPVTVSITRLVEPERIPEVTRWVQSGVNLANRYPGFLGSGWVRSTARSREWHMLYRFADHDSLSTWENSDDRLRWLDLGRDMVVESRVEKRTGIEGWFDVPQDAPASSAPPRWKQAVSIWLGFFPVNLVFTVLVGWLLPSFAHLAALPRVLVTTLVLTPIMTFWVLPFVTTLIRPWLLAPPRRPRRP
ncbi:antibiotic biosynthesis monooxygenase [Curtobacterium herbarum]|uniref:antibiotic biosynthesis monooxygenase n=1 Tax=Curtobacterium herbarum TaxID=150122 RepID=UPI00195BADA7|nr:antibiotic biosynthesis monooxygenase [Curtobacterium herbarum]MBM7476752.1 antibiotic biosynthesis monooxygenase (ABM) superfamily enzyme [Curtobacterium herbarum]MCS6545233.1 antibiotic biosynthesis monooxygenase [Curtobacterium herbarum]